MRGKDPIIPFEWYTLEVERRLRDAKMIIDGKEVVKGKSPGSTRGLNIRMDVYFGGFDGESHQCPKISHVEHKSAKFRAQIH